jgi:hypothetical protein
VGLFSNLFGSEERPEASKSGPTVAPEYVALCKQLFANRIAKFKAENSLSYALILPAIHRLGIRLMIKAQGVDFTKRYYAGVVKTITEEHVRASAVENFNNPKIPSEDMDQHAAFNATMWDLVNEMTVRGVDLVSISHAAFGIGLELAKRALGDDEFAATYAFAVVVASNRELQADQLN